MTTTHSAEFQAFLASLDGPILGRADLEDFDLHALASLKDAERVEAERLLLERLATTNDPRVPRALAGNRSPNVTAALLQQLKRPNPDDTLIESANALLDGEHDGEALAALVRAVHDSGEESQRLRAIGILAAREDKTESADAALLEAMEADPLPSVRAMAQQALLQRYGLSALASVPRSRLRRIDTLRLNPLTAVRRQAFADLTGILVALRAGKSPEALGLAAEEAPESAALARFQDSVGSEKKNAALDLDAFLQLAGDERGWAEVLLLFLLGKADPRAISACATLHLKSAEPALRELAEQTGPASLLARQTLAAR